MYAALKDDEYRKESFNDIVSGLKPPGFAMLCFFLKFVIGMTLAYYGMFVYALVFIVLIVFELAEHDQRTIIAKEGKDAGNIIDIRK